MDAESGVALPLCHAVHKADGKFDVLVEKGRDEANKRCLNHCGEVSVGSLVQKLSDHCRNPGRRIHAKV